MHQAANLYKARGASRTGLFYRVNELPNRRLMQVGPDLQQLNRRWCAADSAAGEEAAGGGGGEEE